MRILVIGCGLMGRGVIQDLSDPRVSPRVESLRIADFDFERARSLSENSPTRNITPLKLDASKRSELQQAMIDTDVVVNTVWYELNQQVMEAAIECKVDYLDLGGLYHITKKQLEFSEKAKSARVLAVLGCGASPGTTNMLASHLARKFDKIEKISIRSGGKILSPTPVFAFPYSLRTIIDELTLRSVVFRNGQYLELDPLSGSEIIDFPEPLGKIEFIHSIHSEIATLPRSIGKSVREVDFKVGFPTHLISVLNNLIELGLAQSNPFNFRGQPIVPKDFICAYLDSLPKPKVRLVRVRRVEMEGTISGKRARAIAQTIDDQTKKILPDLTGVTASIIAQMIGSDEISLKGVYPPEICVQPVRFIEELAKREILVETRFFYEN